MIMLKAVFFDLDGTLLPLNEEKFLELYFKLICKRMAPLGYIPEELVKVIWAGTKNMYLNDGSKTNEEVFWQEFERHYGKDKLVDKAFLDGFYSEEFLLTKNACAPNPLAKEIVKFCKDNNLITVLSTNPIFPAVGTKNRMGFVGLEPSDFDMFTAYENSSFCKPNPKYFLVLLEKYNLKPEEVIVFGNNTYEDGECALCCNMKCYLVGDYVINHPKAVHTFEHIKMEEVIPTIKKHLSK